MLHSFYRKSTTAYAISTLCGLGNLSSILAEHSTIAGPVQTRSAPSPLHASDPGVFSQKLPQARPSSLPHRPRTETLHVLDTTSIAYLSPSHFRLSSPSIRSRDLAYGVSVEIQQHKPVRVCESSPILLRGCSIGWKETNVSTIILRRNTPT